MNFKGAKSEMKKKFIIIGLVIVITLISICIPVREELEWTNDDPIAEVGHYEKCYYNIYGGNITKILKLFKNK